MATATAPTECFRLNKGKKYHLLNVQDRYQGLNRTVCGYYYWSYNDIDDDNLLNPVSISQVKASDICQTCAGAIKFSDE